MITVIDPRASPEYEPYLSVLPPDEYVVVPDVALLDEHSYTHPKTGKEVKVDAKELRRVCDNLNKKMSETHDATPHVIGHTKDDTDEENQPTILGWYVRYRVHQLLDSPRQAIHGDLFVKKAQVEEARKYPRRSVEYWPGRADIDPVSALSSTAPQRNLGLLRLARGETEDAVTIRYSRSDDDTQFCYRYAIPTNPQESAMADEVKDDKPKDTPVEADAKMGEGKSFKELLDRIGKLEEMVSEQSQQFEGLIQALTEDQGDDKDGDKDEPKDKKGKGDKDKEPEPEPEDSDNLLHPVDDQDQAPVKMDANSTNAFVPSTNDKDKTKMSRTDNDDLVLKYDRMAAKQAETEAVLKDTVLKLRRAEAEKTIATLESAPNFIDFGDAANRVKELDLMANLSEKSLPEHLERVKLNYKRKQTDNVLDTVLKHSRSAAATGTVAEPEDMTNIVALMKSGKSYDEALATVKGGK
jgi:hypothetical protein